MATPTYASFLNRIESHFSAIDTFVIGNSDYPDWPSLQLAMAKYISYRNSHRDERVIAVERKAQVA